MLKIFTGPSRNFTPVPVPLKKQKFGPGPVKKQKFGPGPCPGSAGTTLQFPTLNASNQDILRYTIGFLNDLTY